MSTVFPSSAAASARMKANPGRDTSPERRLRSELHRRGYRFRVHRRLVLGATSVRPDILFPRERIAIYVDGCFWHGCPDHGTRPKANERFWAEKFAANAARDWRANEALRGAGWNVIRIWEHVGPAEAAERVAQALRAAR